MPQTPDPFAEFRRRAASHGYTPQQIEEEVQRRRGTSQATAQEPAARATTAPATPNPLETPDRQFSYADRLRAIGQGASFGFGEEAEALVRSLKGPETYAEEVGKLREQMKAYRSERPVEAYGLEIGGGLLTGGLAAKGLQAVGRGVGMIPRLAAGVARSPAALAATEGAIAGTGMSEGDLTTRAQGAAAGAAGGAVLSKAFQAAGKVVPWSIGAVARRATGVPSADLAGRTSTSIGRDVISRGRRTVADALATRGAVGKAIAGVIEPNDALLMSRRMTEAGVPGSATGKTEQEIRQAAQRAKDELASEVQAAQQRAVQEQARLGGVAEEQVLTGARKATEVRQKAQEAIDALSEDVLVPSQQRAAERLQGYQQRIRGRAEQIAAAGEEEATQQMAGFRERARQALENAKGEATDLDTVRKNLQSQTDELTNPLYKSLEGLPAPVAFPGGPDPHLEVLGNSILRNIADNAERRVINARNARLMKTAAEEGREIAADELTSELPRRSFNVGIDAEGNPKTTDIPELGIELLDQMRREVRERMSPGAAVGISRSEGSATLNAIDRIEKRVLQAYPADVGESLIRARALQREKFANLEALQDGLNLGRYRAAPGSKTLLAPDAFDLTTLQKEMQARSASEIAHFQMGAREWLRGTLAESPDDVIKVIRSLTNTEANRTKMSLLLGQEAADNLTRVAGETVEETVKATRRTAQQSAASFEARAQRLAKARAERPVEQAREAIRTRTRDIRDVSSAEAQAIEVAAREQARATRTAAQELARSILARPGEGATAQRVGRLTKTAEIADLAKQALSGGPEGGEQAVSFTRRFLTPSATGPAELTGRELNTVKNVVGSYVRRELEGVGRPGLAPDVALSRLQELQRNPMIQSLFGKELSVAMQRILERRAIIPAAMGAYTGGKVGSRTQSPEEQ